MMNKLYMWLGYLNHLLYYSILWFFVGGAGGLGGFGFGRYGAYGYDATSNCDVERRNLISVADTNYRIIEQANATRQVVESTAAATQEKIDFYAYQDLRDKLAESQRENMMLQNQLYSNAKFGEVEKQLATISCQMLKRPELVGVAAACTNAAVINGLGINGLYNQGCGCNGSVLV